MRAPPYYIVTGGGRRCQSEVWEIYPALLKMVTVDLFHSNG